MSGDSDKPPDFTDERMERLKNAMALASAGAFDAALEHLADPIPDRFGVLEEMLRVFLSELKEMNARIEEVIAELERSRLELETKLETIEAQREAIREIGTPIVDAWEGILVLPLVGALDAERAAAASAKLLQRIAKSHARWVLVDLTGVPVIDATTADHLVRMAGAVQLLGSRCLLTGMRPGSASALVALGVDLAQLTSLRSVREGLRYCLTQDRAAGVRSARP